MKIQMKFGPSPELSSIIAEAKILWDEATDNSKQRWLVGNLLGIMDALEAVLSIDEMPMTPGYSEKNYHASGWNECIDEIRRKSKCFCDPRIVGPSAGAVRRTND